MDNSKTAPFWDEIDAILIINLSHRTDRWEQLHGKLESMGVADKVHRIDAVDGKTLKGYKQRPWFRDPTPENVSTMKAGSAGCCLSQKKVMAYAKEKGFKRILMLEDDAFFKNGLKGRQGDMIAEILRQDGACDMLYLGYYQRKNKHYVAKQEEIDGELFELWRIRGPLYNHAIVMNDKVVNAWLEALPDEKNIWPWMTYWGSIDAWVQNKFGRDSEVRIWATNPHLVVQKSSYSDILGREMSEEESAGTHRDLTFVPLEKEAFERTLDRQSPERTHQALKRSLRVFRAWLFGYKKT